MLGLLSAASSVLGGGGPLSGLTSSPEDTGPQTSQATVTTTATQTTGAFTVGGGMTSPWLYVAGGVLAGYLLHRARIL